MRCHEHHRDLILLYAAAALDAPEQAEVEAHLSTGCSNCTALLAEAEAVVAGLSLALPPVEPPPTAKPRLMRRIRSFPAGDRRDPGDASLGRATPFAAAAMPLLNDRRLNLNGHVAHRFRQGSERTSETEHELTWGWPSSGVLGRVLPVGVAAGVAAALTLGALFVPIYQQQARIDRLELELRAAGQAVTEHETQVEDLRYLVQTGAALFDSLQSSALRLIPLRGETETYGNAVARLLWDEERNICHFFASQLQPPEQGKSYQLWLVTEDERMVPAGRFDLDDSGTAHFQFGVPENVGPIAYAGVSYADAETAGNAEPADHQPVAWVLKGSVR